MPTPPRKIPTIGCWAGPIAGGWSRKPFATICWPSPAGWILTLGGPSTRDFAAPRRTLYLMTIRSDRTGFGPLVRRGRSAAARSKRGIVSTVAPQSLFLMNNEFVVAQAGALADRMLAESAAAANGRRPAMPPADAESRERARIERLYELLYARPVTDREVAVGRQLLAARRAVSDERGAWLAYCQVLLCANEFIYID